MNEQVTLADVRSYFELMNKSMSNMIQMAEKIGDHASVAAIQILQTAFKMGPQGMGELVEMMTAFAICQINSSDSKKERMIEQVTNISSDKIRSKFPDASEEECETIRQQLVNMMEL